MDPEDLDLDLGLSGGLTDVQQSETSSCNKTIFSSDQKSQLIVFTVWQGRGGQGPGIRVWGLSFCVELFSQSLCRFSPGSPVLPQTKGLQVGGTAVGLCVMDGPPVQVSPASSQASAGTSCSRRCVCV